MALTAQPWSPSAHDAMVQHRLSLDAQRPQAELASSVPEMAAGTLSDLQAAFQQRMSLSGGMLGRSEPPASLSTDATVSRAGSDVQTSQRPSVSFASSTVPKIASEDDVFSAIGGMEMGGKPETDASQSAVASSPHSLGSGFGRGPSIGDLPMGETPSRTLVVRNLDPGTNAAELQKAFEAYGEVRTLYTACVARGFVMITYFDLRAACLAVHSLQGAALGNSSLDIHFSAPREGSAEMNEGNVTLYNLDTSVSLEKLYQSFVTFGDVKDIHIASGRPNAKVIEFYDVRHAAAAYQALSAGGHSNRRTKSFDMAALPSVPEMNPSQVPEQTSHESLQGLARGTGSWDSHHSSRELLTSQAVAHSPSQPQQQLPHALNVGSTAADIAAQQSAQLTQLQQHSQFGVGAMSGLDASMYGSSLGAGGLPPSGSGSGLAELSSSLPNGSSRFGSGSLPPGLGLRDAGRQLSGGQMSGSTSLEHLQRLSSSGHRGSIGGGGGGMPGLAPLRSTSGQLSGSMPGSLGGRLGSGDGAAGMQLPSAMASAAAQRLQHLSSGGSGSLPPGLAFDNAAMTGGLGSLSGSLSANDLAALYEAQNAQLAAQQAQLLQQQRTLAALHSASSLGTSQQHLMMNAAAASFSPGSSPAAHSWPHQQPLQGDAQLRQAQQAALFQSAGFGGLSVDQLQALLAEQQREGLPRSHSTSAMLQQQLSGSLTARMAAALQAQGAASQLAGRLGPKDRRGSEGDAGGRFARRASDGVAAERRSAQERLYSLDLDRVLTGNDARTTLMIKNIPNKYTQKMLLATLDEVLRGCYDFFYLPIDFKNKCNVGYAFINLLRPEYVVPLVERFNNRKWEKFNSEKVCSITYARIQGKNAMVAHFQNSSLLHEDKRCRPVLFYSDGPMAGESEPFPIGPNSRLRPVRTAARDTHREAKLREREGIW